MARGRFRPNVVRWWELKFDDLLPSDDPAFNDYLVLAEGDSWFTLGGFPTSNLLFSLRFRKRTLIVNCGMPGDTIKRMSEIANNRSYREALSRRDGMRWNLILLSGGGNDLIDDADEIVRDRSARGSLRAARPEDYCDGDRLDRLIDDIQAGYRRLVALRDVSRGPAKGKPIVTHTYDYATPRNSPARFVAVPILGPWLFKALRNAEVPEDDWIALADYLADRLAEGILDLSKGRGALRNFHVVDTRGTLRRARPGTVGEDGDWLNEIHPDQDGYRKIAKALEPTIKRLL